MAGKDVAVVLAVTVIGAAALSSCGGPEGGTPTEGASASPTSTSRAAALPISGAMRMSGDFATVTTQAGEKLVAECMKKAGFTYRTHDFGNALSGMDDMPIGPFGIESLKDFPEPVTSAAQQEQWTPSKEEQTQAYQQALNGSGKNTEQIAGPDGQNIPIPTDGCQFESMQTLFGSREAAVGFYRTSMAMAKAQQDAQAAADAKPEMIAALTTWRSCMSKRGASFTKPMDVMSKMPPNQKLSTWKTAKDDVACKTESGLLDTGYRILAQTEQEQVDKNPGLTTGIQDTMATVNDRAKQVLAGTLTP